MHAWFWRGRSKYMLLLRILPTYVDDDDDGWLVGWRETACSIFLFLLAVLSLDSVLYRCSVSEVVCAPSSAEKTKFFSHQTFHLLLPLVPCLCTCELEKLVEDVRFADLAEMCQSYGESSNNYWEKLCQFTSSIDGHIIFASFDGGPSAYGDGSRVAETGKAGSARWAFRLRLGRRTRPSFDCSHSFILHVDSDFFTFIIITVDVVFIIIDCCGCGG